MDVIFSSEHAIWKFANAADELNDWLPFAEDLILRWAKQSVNEVKFGSTFEIILAAFLLKDDLLPGPAKAAFAELMLTVIDEGSSRHLHSDALLTNPGPSGRKKDALSFHKLHQVKSLI